MGGRPRQQLQPRDLCSPTGEAVRQALGKWPCMPSPPDSTATQWPYRYNAPHHGTVQRARCLKLDIRCSGLCGRARPPCSMLCRFSRARQLGIRIPGLAVGIAADRFRGYQRHHQAADVGPGPLQPKLWSILAILGVKRGGMQRCATRTLADPARLGAARHLRDAYTSFNTPCI